MKIVVTGSSGRIGRAIFAALMPDHDVVGIDRIPFATTRLIGDFATPSLLKKAMQGADIVIHTAALHAPHVGVAPDSEFERINVAGTQMLADAAAESEVRRIVFTSTTALYGRAVAGNGCTWISEETPPQPVNVYHRTKLAAEALLEKVATRQLSVRVLRMSRCFPERADLMAVYRLHRGIDARDVADAHKLALSNEGPVFQRFIVSGATPFRLSDCTLLGEAATEILEKRVPRLTKAFHQRGWRLPQRVDRVYAPTAAEEGLGWRTRLGFEEVLAQLDRRSLGIAG